MFCDRSHHIAVIPAVFATEGGQAKTNDLIYRERLHPAIVRRLDDMCAVLEV
jgi:hypothetical protein